jgi:hypothetical protein
MTNDVKICFDKTGKNLQKHSYHVILSWPAIKKIELVTP